MALVAFFGLLAVSFGSCTKDLEDRLDKVEKDVATLITDVATLKTTLGDLSKTVASHVEAIKKAQDDIKAIGDKDGVTDAELKAAVTALENKITAAQDAAAIKSVVTNADGSVEFTYREGGVEKKITYKPGSSAGSKVEIDNTSNPNVIIVKVDGAVYEFPKFVGNSGITSIVYIPTYTMNDVDNNFIKQGYIRSIDGVNPRSVFNCQDINFRLNPSDINVSNASWKFVSRTTKSPYTRAVGDSYTLFVAPTGEDIKPYGTGAYTFKLAIDKWVEPTDEVAGVIFALEADGKVTSDYVNVMPEEYKAAILNKMKTTGALSERRYIEDSLVIADVATPADYEFAYDVKQSDKLNINDLVAGYAWHEQATLDVDGKLLADHRFHTAIWKFTPVKSIVGGEQTDLSTFISIDKDGVISPLRGTAGVDRMPIIMAELMNADSTQVIARTYIKFLITRISGEITAEVEAKEPYTYASLFKNVAKGTVGGDEYFTSQTKLSIDWNTMNNIYEKLKINHTEFAKYYNVVPTVDPVGNFDIKLLTGDTMSVNKRLVVTPNADKTQQTSVFTYLITPYSKFGVNQVTFTFKPLDATTHPKFVLSFKYHVIKPELQKEILTGYRAKDDTSTVIVKGGRGLTGDYKMEAYLGEAFDTKYNLAFDESSWTLPAGNKIHGALHQFRFAEAVAAPFSAKLSTISNTVADKTTFFGNNNIDAAPVNSANVVGSTFYPKGDLIMMGTRDANGPRYENGFIISLADKLVEEKREFKMIFRTEFVNLEVNDFKYTVRFVNPLDIKFHKDAKFNLFDLGGNKPYVIETAKNYQITFKDLLMFDQGVAQDGTVKGTINALDYMSADEITNVPFAYELKASTHYPIFKSDDLGAPSGSGLKNSFVAWNNQHNTITTKVEGGVLTVKFTTGFAEVTKKASYYVVPSNYVELSVTK